MGDFCTTLFPVHVLYIAQDPGANRLALATSPCTRAHRRLGIVESDKANLTSGAELGPDFCSVSLLMPKEISHGMPIVNLGYR
ncbi:hypothetical protein VSDG_07998 [Cytospora chrysosperma]|uniref:Uncharacterized protein n=1 Tax=Cytospora chrysosperma TaxID=252740 RepID=A0A423VIP1_CYTCH|nr:hypothetical protein VSDG_07998 [Valsa sordida]